MARQKNKKKESIQYLMMTYSMLVLFILPKNFLPGKIISVNWALFRSKNLGTIHLTVFKRVTFSCQMRWSSNIFATTVYRTTSVLETVPKSMFTKAT